MTNKNDPFKEFITKNTSENLKKPVNEFSEILQKVENKKSFLTAPKWLILALTTASIAISVNLFLPKNNLQHLNDDDLTFLFESYDDSFYDEDSDEDLLEEFS